MIREESDFIVGLILDEDTENFQPANDLRNFLNKWQSERIFYIGFGSMMSIMFNHNLIG